MNIGESFSFYLLVNSCGGPTYSTWDLLAKEEIVFT